MTSTKTATKTTATATIKWEEPPAVSTAVGTRWADVFAEFRKKPGCWANLGEHATSVAMHIKKGRLGGKSIQPGEFEAVARDTRGPKRNRATIYARYVGSKQ